MVREFKLINEYNQPFSLMDIENYSLLTEPDGLGYSYSSNYVKIGETFINNLRKQEQTSITGICNFSKYDNYTKLINFIERSTKLRISYKIPYDELTEIEYFKDVELSSIGKTEKKLNSILSCPISFNTTSLWYEQKEYIYDLSAGSNEVRWNFIWGSRFINYNSRKLEYDNTGHTEAPIYLEIDGIVHNPKIVVTDENKNKLFELKVEIDILEYEKFIYSSVDGNIQIAKQNIDGTYENLFKQQYIDITNNNIFKLPQGISKLTISSDDEITSAKLKIYPYYRSI